MLQDEIRRANFCRSVREAFARHADRGKQRSVVEGFAGPDFFPTASAGNYPCAGGPRTPHRLDSLRHCGGGSAGILRSVAGVPRHLLGFFPDDITYSVLAL